MRGAVPREVVDKKKPAYTDASQVLLWLVVYIVGIITTLMAILQYNSYSDITENLDNLVIPT